MKQLLTILLAIWQLTSLGQGTQIVPIKRKSNGEILYYASTTRNKSVYPLTSDGIKAFNNAVDQGAFRLSVMCPCGETGIIPVGTRPPVIPPCVTNCVSAPNWSSSWYDYDGNTLTVRATGADQTLRFERADGQAFTLSNPDGVPINNNTFYDHATLPGNVYQWQVIFPNAPQLKLTYKRKSDNATYVKTFTPATGANNVNLFTAGTGGGTGNTCNLMVAVNSPTVNCGAAATLTATASGTSASGATYSWTGPNNFVASGASIVVATAQANGSAQYTVTVSKNGCQASATSTVTVTGCQDVPLPPTLAFSFQAPTQQTPWMGYSGQGIGFIKKSDNWPVDVIIGDYDYLENEFVRVEIRRGLGCLVQVKDKVSGRWLINSPDLGRGDGPSSYTQQDYTNRAGAQPGMNYNGENPAPGPWFTGYNPLKDGDWTGHPSTLLSHGKITIGGVEYIYIKTQLNSWSHDNNFLMPMYLEQWVALQGKVVKQWNKLTHQRTNNLTDYGPYKQEWRLMMINGFLKEAVYYNGHQPYTNAGVTRSNGVERGDQNSGYVTPGPAFGVSEPWIGVTIDQNNPNRVIAHYAPDLYWPSYNAMDLHEGGDCDGCKTGMYTSGHVLTNLDAMGTWYFRDDWIVGDINSDVRAYVYAQDRAGPPHYYFNATTQRAGWYGFNGVNDPQLPNAATNARGWTITWNGKTDNGQTNIDNTFIGSPRTAFKASTCPKLYVKVKLASSPQTQYKVKWTYVGQEREPLNGDTPNENARRFPLGLRPDSQSVNFSMQADNQWHTYEIPMPWDGNRYVNNIEIWANGSNMQTKPQMDIMYIGYQNPN